ncbi:penicillin-binding transpeptidase domain-containing protein [Paenibacillus eucommiae]|uniref:Penicillin-binding protein 2B n=1 Tax=Paenibacillus eucommiae TaxID=1355755 RepID=A0ABS4J0Z2_9BACL|nr:penicillin-binding transpeptidase domain-containing protein [Paenibacillus eucommiae]MBP1992801.1 penicillin-binding protein 2B [Paenibacillus eucommiae]
MTKKIRARSLLIGGVFTLLFVILLVKVYYIQGVDASRLLGMAKKAWETDQVLAPERGSIVDRNNKALALNTTAYTVSLNPQLINKNGILEEVVEGLSTILLDANRDKAELTDKIRQRATRKKDDGINFAVSVEIRNEGWKIDKSKADLVLELDKSLRKKLNTKLKIGIELIEEEKRYYPGDTLASHLLGFMSKEGKAVSGLEASMDEVLTGVAGKLKYETDAKGIELPDSKIDFLPAEDGKNIRLTIDKNIQFYIESALAKVEQQFHPKSMTAIAVNPQTMEILGMANVPTFNPNEYWNFNDQGDFINHAVASQYEPGSTFKIVTLAGAVEENLFNPNEIYQSGSIRVPGRTLHDHNWVGWGPISYLDGLKRSSNVAFVKLGYEKLGPKKLEDYIRKFGFGEKSNIDILGEVSGLVKLKYESDFATATYGQGGVVVTALQQTAAYAAIANGGKLMWPHVVKDIVDPVTGEVVESFAPREISRVVSESTAKQVSEYLEQVVSDKVKGTGNKAAIEGYRVAGKTGTANLVVEGGKGYADKQWVISFIGYAPVENPQILVTIIVDRPELNGNYHNGGYVAAPAFKEIVSQTLQYLGVASSTQQTKQTAPATDKITVPDFTVLTLTAAKESAERLGLTLETLGKGAKVVMQYPKAGAEVGPAQRVYIAMEQPEALPLPDFTGESLRDAIEFCSFLKVNCQTVGEGYVVSQTVTGEGDSKAVVLQLSPLNKPASTVEEGTDPNGSPSQEEQGSTDPNQAETSGSEENQGSNSAE